MDWRPHLKRTNHKPRRDLGLRLIDGLRPTHGHYSQACPILLNMAFLSVAPSIEVKADRVSGCTAWPARLLVLFAYCRWVTIDRGKQEVHVTTRWFWLWKSERIIPFDRVSRIIYRAQGLPSLSPMRYLSLQASDLSDSAFFLISIAIKAAADDRRAREELTLFSVWEQQPRESDWMDKLAGVRNDDRRIGDETSGAIVEVLRAYIGVPVASH